MAFMIFQKCLDLEKNTILGQPPDMFNTVNDELMVYIIVIFCSCGVGLCVTQLR
jgi:hypothetical protein